MKRTGQRGVSLIEAIVAMAVMAFGMMAIVGLQTTLRQNSDIAKQRSEAVRFAEEAIEDWRRFSEMGTVALPKMGYGNIQTPPDETKGGLNANYTLTRTVTAGQGWKSIAVQVSWDDRAGARQSVTLNSIIAAADPALSGILTMAHPGAPALSPGGRNAAIPAGADQRDNGKKSIFIPDGGVLWVFDNLSGVIVGVCNTVVTGQAQVTEADTQACVASTTGFGLPLSGYVRFAAGLVQPTAADSEFPTSLALNLDVALALTSTGHAIPDHICYADAPSSAATTRIDVPYFCAIFFNAGVVPVWSGISTLVPRPFTADLPGGYVPWALATSAGDTSTDRYRVCRYTPATSDVQSIPNAQHPRVYTNVQPLELLTNQNFLVIRAGNDPGDGTGTAFTCPTDGPANPSTGDFVNSNTLVHQPAPTPP